MQYGLYISASAVSAAMARQDVLSNNLANVNTVGFRPDSLDVRSRTAVREEDGVALGAFSSGHLLEKLGAGVYPVRTSVSLSQGSLRETKNPLDLALEGNGFFVTHVGNPGEEGDDSGVTTNIRFTRDGRMTTRFDGTLVNSASGFPVLTDSGSTVRINTTSGLPVSIESDGTIHQGASVLGKLQIATVADPSRLIKEGDSLLRPEGQSVESGTAMVRPGYLESSSTDPIRAMIGVTSASNAASGALAMISYYSDIMSRAIQSLGRVS
ncbi:MAG: flagellar hook-basal body protein [Phycisphaerales bacterium]